MSSWNSHNFQRLSCFLSICLSVCFRRENNHTVSGSTELMVQYTFHTQFNKFKSSTIGEIDRPTVADLRRSVPPLRPKIFSISCSFFGSFTKLYIGASPFEGRRHLLQGFLDPPLDWCYWLTVFTSINWLTPLVQKFVIKLIQILNSSVVKFCSLLVSEILKVFLLILIFGGHKSFLCCHWYPCFGLHLLCDTRWPLGSWALFDLRTYTCVQALVGLEPGILNS